MDVIALAQFEITYAVATLGTACGEDHLLLAFKYCSEIVFCFDGDNAGRSAARRALENTLPSMTDGRQVKFLFLPEGQDPDSLVRQIGKARFEQEIEQAIPLEDYFFRTLAEGLNMHSMEGRARFSKLAAPQLHRLPPGVYRELMFQQLSRHTGLSLDLLQELIDAPKDAPAPLEPEFRNTKPPAQIPIPEQINTEQTPAANSATIASPPRQARQQFQTIKITPARMAIMLLLEHPELVKTLDEQWQAEPAAADEQLLAQLINSIRQHQLQSFHSIMGFWAGEFGVVAQRELTDLVSNQFLGAVKKLSPFDAEQELQDAFKKLSAQAQQRHMRTELAQLQAIPLDALDDGQKNRLRELLRMKLLSR